jgi:hypothetical protein
MSKKLVAVLFAMLIMVVFAACGDDDPVVGGSSKATSSKSASASVSQDPFANISRTSIGNDTSIGSTEAPADTKWAFPGADCEGTANTIFPNDSGGSQNYIAIYSGDYVPAVGATTGSTSLKVYRPDGQLAGSNGIGFRTYTQMTDNSDYTNFTFWMRGKATGAASAIIFCFGSGSDLGDPTLKISNFAVTNYTIKAGEKAGFGSGTGSAIGSYNYQPGDGIGLGDQNTLDNIDEQKNGWHKYTASLPVVTNTAQATPVPSVVSRLQLRVGRQSNSENTGWVLYFDDFLWEGKKPPVEPDPDP